MATQQDNEKIIWVAGNRQSIIIPIEMEVIPQEGEPYTEDFYPAEDDVVKVILTGSYRNYNYTPQVDGHLLIVTDPGTLPKGCYGVNISVVGKNGTTRLRSLWKNQIVVTESNNSVLKEWDEFKSQPVQARAAVFFFAKGDPFTYDDFTPEQIAELQKPARDVATEITEDYAEVKQDAQQATNAANDAAQNANDKAGEANSAAQNASNKGDYAKGQGDYAKQKADEIEDAKGTYQTLNARLNAMEADTATRLEAITEEQLNEIFN